MREHQVGEYQPWPVYGNGQPFRLAFNDGKLIAISDAIILKPSALTPRNRAARSAFLAASFVTSLNVAAGRPPAAFPRAIFSKR